jgi:hypothetical protein
MTGKRFSPSNYVPESRDFPAHEAPFKVEYAFERQTHAGDGWLIEAEIKLTAGPVSGQKLRCYFNTDNPSERATKIGLAQLNSFCHCIGQMADWEPDPKTGDCHDLVGRSGVVKVGPQKDKAQFGEVKSWVIPKAGEAQTRLPSAAPRRPAAGVQAPPPHTPSRPVFDDDVPF